MVGETHGWGECRLQNKDHRTELGPWVSWKLQGSETKEGGILTEFMLESQGQLESHLRVFLNFSGENLNYFKIYLYVCVCVCLAYLSVYVPCDCTAWGDQKGCHIPWNWSYRQP